MSLLKLIIEHHTRSAFTYDSVSYDYKWLRNEVEYYLNSFDDVVKSGDVVQLCSDYSPKAVAVLIALIIKNAIIAPLTSVPVDKLDEYSLIMQPQLRINIDIKQHVTLKQFDEVNEHPLIREIRNKEHPGLIIMSSGTSGTSKAIIHDLSHLIDVQKPTRYRKIILSFLLFDHIGGINTMLNSIVSGNKLAFPTSRDVNAIANLIQEQRVQVLITSPTFLNLMTINNVWGNFDFSSLEHINYGSEVMPSSLLNRLSNELSGVKLSQAYGASEMGVLKTTSESNASLLIKIDSSQTQYRVIDGKLELKSNTSMLGYLNAPHPFSADGWFITGDMVEVSGEWIKILGRESDIINVGGQKVFPTEVENVILQIPEVRDVSVAKESNAILGNIVNAKVIMDSSLSSVEKIKLIREHCFKSLEKYKVPQRIEFIEQISHCRRFKKQRHSISTGALS